MKRIIVITLIIAVIMTSLAACSQETGNSSTSSKENAEEQNDNKQNDEKQNVEKQHVLFWHTYSDAEENIFNEKVVESFINNNENIDLEVVRMPYDGLKQQLITSIAGGVAPDVMRMDIIWVPEFAHMGALEKVDDKEGFEDIKGNLFEGPLNTTYYNGNYYGLPLNTNTKVAIYNKSLLNELGVSEPPKTMDELIELSRQLKNKEDVWGIGLGGTHSWGMPPYFWSLGGRITNDEYTVASGYINSEASVKALETIVSLYDEGLIGPCILGEEPNTWGGMEANNYLMIEDGPWYFSIQQGIEEKVIPELFPAGEGGSRSIIGGEDVVMFANSKNKDAAWEFMKHLLSEETQLTMGTTGLIPTLKTAANNEEFANNPINKVYVKQLETALPRTPHYKWEQISEEFQITFELAIRKEGEPKQLLDDLAVRLDQILSE